MFKWDVTLFWMEYDSDISFSKIELKFSSTTSRRCHTNVKLTDPNIVEECEGLTLLT